MADEEFTPEELAELGESQAPVGAKPKRGGTIKLPPEAVTIDSVMSDIGTALTSPAKLLKSYIDGLAASEKTLRASKSKLNKAVNTAVSGAQSKDSVLIINTKSLNVDDALQDIVTLRVMVTEANMMPVANRVSTKKTSLDKGIKTVKAAAHMMQSAAQPDTTE